MSAPAGLPAKVLIANRGEIAVRIARTCHAMGMATVAVFSDADAGALHVAVCDEAVRLGGATPAESYLRAEAIVEAAHRTGATAVHPGFGFLSESPAFARQVQDAGLLWVGPPAEAIEAMGDKIAAKRLMAEAGVPLVPGEELDAGADLWVAGDRVGYPLLVKAAAGGGGKGMRVVEDPDELEDAVAAARREAGAAFGDDRLFLERLLPRPRHVEVQVLADAHGEVVHLFERECSIQRRHQKVIEESPSPGIDPGVREAMGRAAVAAARAIGYVSAGTVEFVASDRVLARRRAGEELDPERAFAFLEVNTRLQVEHPVTEEVVRVAREGGHEWLDLVRLQLLIAAGAPLSFAQEDLRQVGHAVEARLYAEDPAADHLPVTGTLHAVDLAEGPGVRHDRGVRSGDEVSPHYDPMLAKAIAWAPTRAEAAARLSRALARSVLLGTTTNRDLLVAVLRDEAFLAGETTTSFLAERFADPAAWAPDAGAVEVALLAVALAGASRDAGTGPSPGFSSGAAVPIERVYEVAGRIHRVRLHPQRDGTWSAVVDAGNPRSVAATTQGAGWWQLEVDGLGHRRRVASHGRVHQVVGAPGAVDVVEQPRFPATTPAVAEGVTTSPMPGSVVDVAVAPGDAVAQGALLVTVEAMKMEHRVLAPFAGTVAEVRVAPGGQVEADEVLVVVEPETPAPA